MELARHPQTLLAYEMNGKPLPLEHGAPLRLRVETLLGYKMVKYLRSIEFVAAGTAFIVPGRGRRSLPGFSPQPRQLPPR